MRVVYRRRLYSLFGTMRPRFRERCLFFASICRAASTANLTNGVSGVRTLSRTEIRISKHLQKIFGSIEPNKKSIGDPLSFPNSTRIFWAACLFASPWSAAGCSLGLSHNVI